VATSSAFLCHCLAGSIDSSVLLRVRCWTYERCARVVIWRRRFSRRPSRVCIDASDERRESPEGGRTRRDASG